MEPIDFAQAIGYGLEGYTVIFSEELETVLDKFFSSENPSVLQIDIDPNEMPKIPEKMITE